MTTATRLFVAAILAAALNAQDPRGNLTGRVQDSSGAVMPGVAVRAVNTETGVAATAATNEAGAFSIPYLLPGIYRVEAELTGFRKFIRDGVEVRVGDTVELIVAMQVGSITETLEITAQSPLLETASASVGQVIDQRRILELPQRSGNPIELALLTS